MSGDDTQAQGFLTEFTIAYRQGTAYARITYKGRNPSRVVSKMQLGLH